MTRELLILQSEKWPSIAQAPPTAVQGRWLRSSIVAFASLSISIGLSLVPARSIAADSQTPVARDDGDALIAHVLGRLAFGPRPGDIDRVRRIGVDAYIDEQLHPDRIALPDAFQARLDALDMQRLPAGTLIDGYRSEQRAVREARRAQAAGGDGTAPAAGVDNGAVAERRREYRRLTLQASEARLLQAIDSPRQLQEVMTDFWFNHFNVFVGKGLDRVLVADYERDAIRPHAMGRFRDLLGATAKHPAMLFYLDNWLSTGADADVNRNARQRAGLNENYARELMELHTLGVGGDGTGGSVSNVKTGTNDKADDSTNDGADFNYTQKDVTELARMLTGWTFDARATGRGGPLEGVESQALFVFVPRRHDNGLKTWLGHTIRPNGQQEGEYALDVLAMHPATARHISAELAQYFVADRPPQALVDRLTARYLATDGDIGAVLRTLFHSPEFRSPAAIDAKFKTPYQYVVSAARASGLPVVDVRPLVGALARLGMPLYGCLTPDGYKNTEAAWLNPEGMTRRIDFATALATGRLAIDRPPLQPAEAAAAGGGPDAARATGIVLPARRVEGLATAPLLETLGTTIGERTRAIVLGGEPRLAAALVLGSPDFMRH